jgi:NitT/TauT family transport system ATP-binding protein
MTTLAASALLRAAAEVESREVSPRPQPDRDCAVRLEGVTKVFGRGSAALVALDGIDLEVGRGEFVCMVGASGCGKSTLLSLIAGLDRPTTGSVDLAGNRTALMFQEAALLPWLTVERNIDLPLRLQQVPRQERQERVAALLSLVHLDGFGRRRPHELSGGMRQRVALARALAQHGDVLLMDEPFASLDAITRDILHEDLERIVASTGMTVVFVTHNVREAVRLGDRVVLMTSRPGRVGDIIEIDFDRPRRIEDTDVAAVAREITDLLRAEIGRHGRH